MCLNQIIFVLILARIVNVEINLKTTTELWVILMLVLVRGKGNIILRPSQNEQEIKQVTPSDSLMPYLGSLPGYSTGDVQALPLTVLAVFDAVD